MLRVPWAALLYRHRRICVLSTCLVLVVMLLWSIVEFLNWNPSEPDVFISPVGGEDVWSYKMMPMDVATRSEKIPPKCQTRGLLAGGDEETLMCWDSIYLIGVSKGGTSSLYAALTSHPSVSNMDPARGDAWEMHYFDRSTEDMMKDLGPVAHKQVYLRGHSPKITLPEADADGVAQVPVLLHYTPGYLFYSPAAINIWRLHPFRAELKFVVSLREPMARMWSSYEYKTNGGKKVPDSRHPMMEFEEQFADVERVARCLAVEEAGVLDGNRFEIWKVTDFYEKKCPFNWNLGVPDKVSKRENEDEVVDHKGLSHHVGKSIYYLQLKMWFRLFDRRQFFIVTAEEIRAGTRVHLDLVQWLGLPVVTGSSSNGFKGFYDMNTFHAEMRRAGGEEEAANETTGKRKIEDVLSASEIDSLAERFKPWNAKLNALLERDVGYPT